MLSIFELKNKQNQENSTDKILAFFEKLKENFLYSKKT